MEEQDCFIFYTYIMQNVLNTHLWYIIIERESWKTTKCVDLSQKINNPVIITDNYTWIKYTKMLLKKFYREWKEVKVMTLSMFMELPVSERSKYNVIIDWLPYMIDNIVEEYLWCKKIHTENFYH